MGDNMAMMDTLNFEILHSRSFVQASEVILKALASFVQFLLMLINYGY